MDNKNTNQFQKVLCYFCDKKVSKEYALPMKHELNIQSTCYICLDCDKASKTLYQSIMDNLERNGLLKDESDL